MIFKYIKKYTLIYYVLIYNIFILYITNNYIIYLYYISEIQYNILNKFISNILRINI